MEQQQNDESTPPAETAAALARIEEKLDLVLEKLQWAPQSETAWYAELYEKARPSQGAQEGTKK